MPTAIRPPRLDAPARGRRARRPIAVALLVVAAILAGCTGPPRPTTGPGSLGPCTETVETIANPTEFGQTLNIYSPGGTAAAPTGGTCNDDDRPAAIVVHGLAASFTWVYAGIISHLVAQGNVVIFATYATDTSNFVGSFQREDAAIVAAAAETDRADLERVGIIGHSMGGGAIAYLVQRLDARGWGTDGLWVMSIAPWVVAGVPAGPIDFPAHARVVVEAYSDDTLVDRSTGIDLYNRIDVPAAQKEHVTLRTTSLNGATLNATHTTPNSVIAPDDAMKFFGIYRIADILQSCSQTGTLCNADLSYMGLWPDGTPVLPAIATDLPT